jgi:hypothetical protein
MDWQATSRYSTLNYFTVTTRSATSSLYSGLRSVRAPLSWVTSSDFSTFPLSVFTHSARSWVANLTLNGWPLRPCASYSSVTTPFPSASATTRCALAEIGLLETPVSILKNYIIID